MISRYTKRILAISLSVSSLSAAHAAEIDVSGAVAKACQRSELDESDRPAWLSSATEKGKVAVVLPPKRLFAFLIGNFGMIAEDGDPGKSLSEEIVFRNSMTGPQNKTLRGKRAVAIVNDLEKMQSDLRFGMFDSLKAVRLDGQSINFVDAKRPYWLLNDEIRFACVYDEESVTDTPKTNVLRSIAKKFRLRESVDGLALTGDDRETAASAMLSYKRERTFLDDGSAKRTATIGLKGVLGLPLYEHDDRSLTAYAGYELNRVRVRPAPSLTPPETQRDSDTDLFKLGVFARHVYELGRNTTVDLSVDGALLNDYVKDSQRLRMKLGITPYFNNDELGFCALGRLNSPSRNFLGVRGICTVQILGEVNHLMKTGTLVTKPNDEFILLGARGAVDFQFADDDKSGLIAGMDYRYFKTVLGTVPDVDRFKAYFKYRFWLKDLALDVGFDYVDGINPDSFADDNSILLSVGLMY